MTRKTNAGHDKVDHDCLACYAAQYPSHYDSPLPITVCCRYVLVDDDYKDDLHRSGEFRVYRSVLHNICERMTREHRADGGRS